MKGRSVFVTALSFFLLVPSMWGKGMMKVMDFGANPGKLNMYIYIPDELAETPSFVIALHGCSQDASELATTSGWNELADQYGFIMVYPEQRLVNNTSRCFNWFNLKDIEGERGELSSIQSMVSFAIEKYGTNDSELFVYGLSAGAAMANSILANQPEVYKAGAIFAGGPHKSAENVFQGLKVMTNPPDKTPEEWGNALVLKDGVSIPKIIVVHGNTDKVVDFRNAQELIDQWSFAHQLDIEVYTDETEYTGNNRVNRRSYRIDDEERIVFYELDEIGHLLVVDPGTGDKQGGQMGAYTEDIDFHSTYYVARDFGLISSE